MWRKKTCLKQWDRLFFWLVDSEFSNVEAYLLSTRFVLTEAVLQPTVFYTNEDAEAGCVCVEFTGMISGSRRNSSSAFRRTESPQPKSGRCLWRCGELFECRVFLRTQSEGSTSPFLRYTLFCTRSPTDPRVFPKEIHATTNLPGLPSGKVYMSVVLPCTTWRRALPTAQMVTSVDVGGDVDLWGRKKNWHHGMPPWWDFFCFLVVFCFGKTSKCLQNDVDIWAMKKTWLVGLYRGWNTTQLSGDYNKPL